MESTMYIKDMVTLRLQKGRCTRSPGDLPWNYQLRFRFCSIP